MAANILVVEDEPAIQELIAVNLQHAGHHVLRAGDAEGALGIVKNALPDLLLIDWMLPGMSGVSLARQLRQEERTRQIPIIMLTARGGEADKIAGLEAGADDYVTKPFSVRELLARIKAVLGGAGAPLPPRPVRGGRGRPPTSPHDPGEGAGLRLDPATRRVFGGGKPLALGPSEFRMLHFLMTHPERVHSRAQLLDQVWGDHVFVEERTVDVHIRRLRKALEPTGHDRLIETVRGSGYRFSADPA
jgi:two-component system, OmpR family, phosphate regulon response regulator PhoB